MQIIIKLFFIIKLIKLLEQLAFIIILLLLLKQLLIVIMRVLMPTRAVSPRRMRRHTRRSQHQLRAVQNNLPNWDIQVSSTV